MKPDSPVDPDEHELHGHFDCAECLQDRAFHLIESDEQPDEYPNRKRYNVTCEWCGLVRDEITRINL